ncbi:hypothetical protein RB619_04485 [Flavobacterium sp. LHD-80]|uniref:Uncharacterized protein n=1 Tax=Flavobacterium nitrogenifigens TaxID=1617283 RepID=A0A521FFV1_9FLAO|nr:MULTISPECIES: hypothetical protein [Flavobacterium]KAF2338840.1 hypothetical protein DM397_02595 [Flavobacterium nitrogenifigens]MDQ6469893.1 hypothetical protein [Flavobacterium sp. LHD-80]MDQ6531929.1 hypothetical protein [Flavobacterium sp. LHD-85]SMO94420.1 hypothetical protein SAMN06265220_11032 [Flavobacterium nitrogenifigens]
MINKILKSKWIYFLLLIGIVLYLRDNQLILNPPKYIFWILFSLSFIILSVLEIKDKIKITKSIWDYFFVMITVSFFSIYIALILKIPINEYIIFKSQNEIFEKKCKISNYISGRSDRLLFYFDDKVYSVGFQNHKHLERKNIIDNYLLRVEYKRSIFNTYVVQEYELIKK